MGVGGQHHAPAILPPGKTPEASGLAWMGEQILAPIRIDPQTIQSIVSHCTKYVILGLGLSMRVLDILKYTLSITF